MLIPLAGALIAVTLLIFAAYTIAVGRSVPQRTVRDMDNSTEILSLYVDDLYESLSYIALSDVIDMDFYEAVSQIHFNRQMPGIFSAAYDLVVVKLVYNRLLRDGLDITYVDTGGTYFSARDLQYRPRRALSITPEEAQACGKLVSTARNPVFTDLSGLSFLGDTGKEFGMILRIRSPREPMGYLILESHIDDSHDIFSAVRSQEGVFAVFNEEGVCIYQSEDWFSPSREKVEEVRGKAIPVIRDEDGTRYVVSVRESAVSGTETVCLYPYRLITREIRRAMAPVFLVVGVLTAAVIGLAFLISHRIARPIAKLTETVRSTTSDDQEALQALVTDHPEDEIAYLGSEYARMTGRLREAMDEKIALVEQREAQRYQFLQYQINPHFIYNTLNMIGIMGMEKGADDVYDACRSTAGILRYSLSDSRLESTFRDEFAIMETYLHLMQMRFESRVRYEISLEDSLSDCLLPRFTLQPFVENIFEHAFDAEHRVVNIWLGAYSDDDGWKIVIRDDGRGMTPDQIEMLNGLVESEELEKPGAGRVDRGRIGIKNTLLRMHIYFGGKLFYQFISGEMGGCTLVLGGPAVREEEEPDEPV